MIKLKELREYVALKATQRPSRQYVGGEDLAKMNVIIQAIPSPEMRQRIQGLFQMYPKYEVLNMLLDERHELMKTHPDLAERIAQAGSDRDYAYEHTPRVA